VYNTRRFAFCERRVFMCSVGMLHQTATVSFSQHLVIQHSWSSVRVSDQTSYTCWSLIFTCTKHTHTHTHR